MIVNFSLEGMSEEDYLGLTETIAPAFSDLPGLVSKTWQADSETNTYGGVYVWRDSEAMEAYKQSGIFRGSPPGSPQPSLLWRRASPNG